MANVCVDCGIPIHDADLFCDECAQNNYDTWMCPECDHQNENDDTTCQECGGNR